MTKEALEVHAERRDDRTWVFRLTGDLYGNKRGYAFQEDVRGKVKAGVTRVVIDLGGIHRMDSSGIGILVASMWSASHNGAGLVLASLSPRVERVMGIAMLLDHIDHAGSVEEALERLDEMKLEPQSVQD